MDISIAMLTLICGLPNAGKTTYSKRYKDVLHLDDMPVRQQFEICRERASQIKGDVVVEGVYVTAEDRKALLEACKDNSPKVCIWLDTSLEECLEREKKYRKRPMSIVTCHHKMLQPPTYDEGWDEIIIER